ncbi:hypothetical protein NC653_013436 [Populus alba x Populus x berolinensis]|nr:hypothetical protein NC653_013434 [Populus alba x Populus x berolinensis]KAJ6996847.1 hypothetical protein NC653_013436 [Populus alba x Populus x berolinensis]
MFFGKKLKCTLFKDCDKGTRFFHSLMSQRNRRHNISAIVRSDGMLTTSAEEVGRVFATYYKELLGTSKHTIPPRIKYEACTDLASLIYSLGYTSESDSELDYTSSPSDFEIMATKEQQDMVANKNSTFTDLDYVIEVIMKQSFNRCETEKEMDACGYEAQVYFSEILDCNMIQDLTANGKWQISTPTTLVSNIPRNDKENGPDNMTVIKEDQQSWPKMNLVHSITLRNGKQIGAIK